MRHRLLGGLFWQGGTTILARGTRYVAVLILGGLLTPDDFGTFASLYVFVDGLFLLQGMGLGEALVIRRDRAQQAADTTFLLAAALGVAFFGVAWLAAPAIESFYRAPNSTAAFRVLASVLVIHSLRVVPLRLFEKSFDFRAKLLPTLGGSVGFLLVSVALAMHGHGVWSFVYAVLVSAALETLLFWMASSWRPRWELCADIARDSLKFGWPVVIGALLTYFFGTIDRVALARWGGPALLGPYAFAFSLAALPTTVNATVVGTVLLPSYSALAEDRERRLVLHLRAASMTAATSALFGLLLVAFGGDALHVVYGDKWSSAAPLLSILAVGAVFRSLGALVGDLLVGVGKPGSYRTMNAIQLGAAALALPLALARGGAAGVALVVSGASVIALAHGWLAAREPLGASFRKLVGCLGIPARAAAAGVVAAVLVRLIPGTTSNLPRMVAAISAVTAVFVSVWWLSEPRLRADVRALLSRSSA